jgi:SAM-dependent methyltransferase
VESSLGIPLPFRSESFDTVYWNDVAEHLHPEDLRFSLREIHRVLRDGGRLCTVTCHRDDGPHDSSMAILPRGSPPQGMHLQEFTYERWNWELMHAGFAAAQPVIGVNVLTKLRLTRVIPTLLSSWSPLLLLEDTSPNRAATLLRWVSGTNVICSIGTKGNPVGPAVVESSPQAG